MSDTVAMGYWQKVRHFSLAAIASTTLTLGYSLPTKANSPDTAPAALTELLDTMEEAANNHELDQLLSLYSGNFAHSDGLNKSDFQEILAQLWQEYPRLSYETELLSWEKDGNQWVAETLTNVRGIRKKDGRWLHLTTEVKSKQYFENQKLVRQEILSEATELNSGNNPPSIKVLIPETVKPKENFGFDVIVLDPLDTDILLGGALEEPINREIYSNPEEFELDILPAGGIFKLVEAPNETGDLLYSALVVRGDGMTMVTRRVKVQKNQTPADKT